jgi:small subunit ribosomal protein S13
LQIRNREYLKNKINMARIAGIDLPKNKRGEIGLTYIYGIGPSTAKYILGKAGIDINKKVNQWNDEEQTAIRNIIAGEIKTEGALRSETQMNIKRLLDIACYRGLRHRKGLPRRGQRTRTNSRTRKGKRKTVAPRARTLSHLAAGARSVTANTVPGAAPLTRTAAVSGVRRVLSTTTRRGFCPATRRTVRRGSSLQVVPTPTMIASCLARSSWLKRSDSGALIH